jgi:hypothetical protein
VAEHRACSACQDRGRLIGERRRRSVTNRVNGSVNGVEEALGAPPMNRAVGDSRRK